MAASLKNSRDFTRPLYGLDVDFAMSLGIRAEETVIDKDELAHAASEPLCIPRLSATCESIADRTTLGEPRQRKQPT
jgi:hypothetical protein